MPLLQVNHLEKHFTLHHLGRRIPAFHEVSFELEPGHFLLVRGQNGSGKSTLLRSLYRTYLPTGGAAWYQSREGLVDLVRAADVDIAHLRRHEIGFVTQFLRARPRVTAVEFVAEPLLASGASAAEAEEAAVAMLRHFGLKPALWHAFPTTFSGGEQQKTNLARALVRERRLLLLDEPTASLDEESRAALASRLAELKAAGVAMVGVLHHPEDVAGLVDNELALPENTAEGVAPHAAG